MELQNCLKLPSHKPKVCQTVTENFHFRGLISTFRAENIAKRRPFKAERMLKKLPEKIRKIIGKVKKNDFFDPQNCENTGLNFA